MQDNFSKDVRLLCMVVVVVLVTACSSIRFVYNQGATLTYFWVNNYVTFNSEQSGAVKQNLVKLFDWHRQTQLNDYIELLGTAQRQLATGQTSPADLKKMYKEIKARAELIANKALPDLAELAMSMKPEQFVRMQKKYRSNNENFKKKYVKVDIETKQRLRFEKSIEELDEWFGEWSDEQAARLRKASDARPLNNEFLLEERILRQKKILAVLRKIHDEKLDKETTTAVLGELIKDMFDRDKAAEHKEFYDANLDGNLSLASLAILISTPVQKAHAQKRMAGLSNDFKQLLISK